MSFFSLLAVFLLEQLQPLSYRRFVRTPVHALADLLAARLNAGAYRHGVLATLVVLVPLLAGLLILYVLLDAANPLLAWALNVLVLYFTMGFRQFSHHYTAILEALEEGDLPAARQLLADWRYANGVPPSCHGRPEQTEDIAREAIELALMGAHRHVFAVLLWFILLPGPIGAVLYRVTSLLAEAWRQGDTVVGGQRSEFPLFARRLFEMLDWLPARATAAAFAIVGNFEDTVYCVRQEADNWSDPSTGIILAGASGALGVRLGNHVPVAVAPDGLDEFSVPAEVEEPFGQEAGIDFMRSAIGLVWRATVLWVLLLFLLGLASFFG